MVLCILILLGIAVSVFYIRKKVGDVEHLIEKRIDELTALSVRPIKTATDIAQAILPKPKPAKKAKRKK